MKATKKTEKTPPLLERRRREKGVSKAPQPKGSVKGAAAKRERS